MNRDAPTQPSASHAVFAGVIGGLLGTLAMNYTQRLWTLAADGRAPHSAGGKHDAREWQERAEGENANELAAQAVATRVKGRPLTSDELKIAAPLVHYTFGGAVGALYGALAASFRGHAVARGAALGTALWLAADEIAMPLLSLSAPTTERPLEKHLQSFASHIVYGVVAELARESITAQLAEA